MIFEHLQHCVQMKCSPNSIFHIITFYYSIRIRTLADDDGEQVKNLENCKLGQWENEHFSLVDAINLLLVINFCEMATGIIGMLDFVPFSCLSLSFCAMKKIERKK